MYNISTTNENPYLSWSGPILVSILLRRYVVYSEASPQKYKAKEVVNIIDRTSTWLSNAFVQHFHPKLRFRPHWFGFVLRLLHKTRRHSCTLLQHHRVEQLPVAHTALSNPFITACKSTNSQRWWDPNCIFLEGFILCALGFRTRNAFRSPMVSHWFRKACFFLESIVYQIIKLLMDNNLSRCLFELYTDRFEIMSVSTTKRSWPCLLWAQKDHPEYSGQLSIQQLDASICILSAATSRRTILYGNSAHVAHR